MFGSRPFDIPDGEARGNNAGGFIDIHCHCLPGVDDGPEDLTQATSLCKSLVHSGVSRVVATPHMLGRYDVAGHLERIEVAYTTLCNELRRMALPLHVDLAAEVRLDERIPSLITEERLLLLGRRKDHLLLELPDQGYVDPRSLVNRLSGNGVRVIIAHAERVPAAIANPKMVDQWCNDGVLIQITASSLTGHLGPVAERTAWQLLANGNVHYVASDAHNLDRRAPQLESARRLVRRRISELAARHLFHDNANLLLTGQSLTRSDGNAKNERPSDPVKGARPPVPRYRESYE